MFKSDLIGCVANVVGNRDTAALVVDTLLNLVTEQLQAGQPLSLQGFGTFRIASRASRKGRNPHSGEEIDIPASRNVKFVPAPGLKQQISDYTL